MDNEVCQASAMRKKISRQEPDTIIVTRSVIDSPLQLVVVKVSLFTLINHISAKDNANVLGPLLSLTQTHFCNIKGANNCRGDYNWTSQ